MSLELVSAHGTMPSSGFAGSAGCLLCSWETWCAPALRAWFQFLPFLLQQSHGAVHQNILPHGAGTSQRRRKRRQVEDWAAPTFPSPGYLHASSFFLAQDLMAAPCSTVQPLAKDLASAEDTELRHPTVEFPSPILPCQGGGMGPPTWPGALSRLPRPAWAGNSPAAASA